MDVTFKVVFSPPHFYLFPQATEPTHKFPASFFPFVNGMHVEIRRAKWWPVFMFFTSLWKNPYDSLCVKRVITHPRCLSTNCTFSAWSHQSPLRSRSTTSPVCPALPCSWTACSNRLVSTALGGATTTSPAQTPPSTNCMFRGSGNWGTVGLVRSKICF